MEGPRAPSENELPQVVEFLNRHLRPNSEWSIAAEYPLALTELNRANIRVILEDQEILSHAVLKPLYTRGPAGLIKAATIGSVVTSTQHRNNGLSQKILHDCLETARGVSCDIAILWTSIQDFYRKMGFELASTEVSLLFDRDIQMPQEQLRIVEGTQVAPDALLRLFNQHTVNSLRTSDDIQRSLRIPNSRVYTLWNSANSLLAYAVEGKGADLSCYIHEWGGSVSKILYLVTQIRRQRQENLTLIAPRHSQGLVRKATELGIPMHSGFLGMIKLIHANQLFGKIKRYARNMGVADLVLEHRDGVFYLGSSASIFKTDSENDMVRLLFGPAKASELAQFDDNTKDILEKVLPIPFWIWGWDSI
jgi:predicted N-acetyltransferase YhbS